MRDARNDRYDTAAQYRIFGKNANWSNMDIEIDCTPAHKVISGQELAKKAAPGILIGSVILMLESYWPVLIASQALPPLGAAAMITAGVLLILYGVYQGAKYISDMKNKPDYEEDVTPLEAPIDTCWDRFCKWGM